MSVDAVVREVPVPRDALAWLAFTHVDFADAYVVRLAVRDPGLAERFAREMFSDQPHWVRAAMKLRDRVVTIFGIKTSDELRRRGGERPRIGAFVVLGRTAGELLLGADDRHLDFRTSIRCADAGGGSEICVVTTVKFNNVLGSLYLIPVKPMHRIIVPTLMRRAAQAIAHDS